MSENNISLINIIEKKKEILKIINTNEFYISEYFNILDLKNIFENEINIIDILNDFLKDHTDKINKNSYININNKYYNINSLKKINIDIYIYLNNFLYRNIIGKIEKFYNILNYSITINDIILMDLHNKKINEIYNINNTNNTNDDINNTNNTNDDTTDTNYIIDTTDINNVEKLLDLMIKNKNNIKNIDIVNNILNKEIIMYNELISDFILILPIEDFNDNILKFKLLPDYLNNIKKNDMIVFCKRLEFDINILKNNKYILIIPLKIYNSNQYSFS
jgi:hypothetical protein